MCYVNHIQRQLYQQLFNYMQDLHSSGETDLVDLSLVQKQQAVQEWAFSYLHLDQNYAAAYDDGDDGRRAYLARS